MKLYGRIEQLTATTGANFPVVFKAMTPQLDTTPGKKLTGKVGVDPTVFSGSIANSFPNDFRGNLGWYFKSVDSTADACLLSNRSCRSGQNS